MEHNSNSSERMRLLEQIESNVYQVMTHATQALNEFGKDKPSIKNVEGQVNQFLKALESVEGSCYASNKIGQMGMQRLEHVRSSLNELEQLKHQHQVQMQKYQSSRSPKTETKSESVEPKVEVKIESN